MRITFLSPRVPPSVCGLGDHTAFLAEALRKKGIEVSFIFCGWQQSAKPTIPGFATAWDGSAAELQQAVQVHQPGWLWIQLSGYGYSRWGAPARLARILTRLRQKLPELRVATYAHELYCEPHQLGIKGPLLSWWQKRTVGQILRQSDLVFSSTPEYVIRIGKLLKVPEERVRALPIGSNVQIPFPTSEERDRMRAKLGWSTDEQVAVVFGSFGSQERTLRQFTPILQQGLKQGRLHRVLAVGGGPGAIPTSLQEMADLLQVKVSGYQPDSQIGSILAAADFGMLAYPRHLLRKSGVFIAYAIAGLAVLAFDDTGNRMTKDDRLPILEAEKWLWEDAKSDRVKEVRQSLREYAEEHWKWEKIASQVLDNLNYPTQRGIPGPSRLSRNPEDPNSELLRT